MNYFSVLCFVWAAVGFVTRVLIAALGERWAGWETGRAYPARRPAWLFPAGGAAAVLVAATWYMAFTAGITGGWAAALLLSFALGKAGAFLFRYDVFRAFVLRAFREPDLMRSIHLFVGGLSAVLVLLGVFYAVQ